MRFRRREIEYLKNGYKKLERLYAFKYEVAKSYVALVIRNYAIHVLVNARLKDTISFKQLKVCTIEEKTGIVGV